MGNTSFQTQPLIQHTPELISYYIAKRLPTHQTLSFKKNANYSCPMKLIREQQTVPLIPACLLIGTPERHLLLQQGSVGKEGTNRQERGLEPK